MRHCSPKLRARTVLFVLAALHGLFSTGLNRSARADDPPLSLPAYRLAESDSTEANRAAPLRVPAASEPPRSRLAPTADAIRPLPTLTQRDRSSATTSTPRSPVPSFGFSLAVLAGLILLAIAGGKVAKKLGVGHSGILPRAAAEVLGRCRVEPRQSIHLVRLGQRILVLSSSSGSLTLLTEVVDPVEVDVLTGLCRTSQPISPFASLLQNREQANEPTFPRSESATQAPPTFAAAATFSLKDSLPKRTYPVTVDGETATGELPLETTDQAVAPGFSAEQRLVQRLRRPPLGEIERAA